MPIILIIIGIILVIAGWRGTEGQLWNLIVEALFPKSAKNNFLIWAAAIFFIGLFGYIEKIRPVIVAFIILVYIVMIIALNKTGALSNILNLNQFNINNSNQTSVNSALQEGQNLLNQALKP